MFSRNFSTLLKIGIVAVCSSALFLSAEVLTGFAAAQPKEILRYDVLWNGGKAGHGDISTSGDSRRVEVVVQAVSDGVLKAVVEIWSRIQASFASNTFKPQQYQFLIKSNLLATESVDLTFDHKSGMVNVDKSKGKERENHCEKVEEAYDPVTAAYLLRSQKNYSKPMYVDIYDGKVRSRLFVGQGVSDQVKVKAGLFPAIKLDLRLVRLTGDKNEVGTARLWVSDDSHRIPLLLTSSHVVGKIRFELVQVQR